VARYQLTVVASALVTAPAARALAVQHRSHRTACTRKDMMIPFVEWTVKVTTSTRALETN